jgi:hypothetical protein
MVEFDRRTLIIGSVGGLVLGLLLGMALFWGLFPVKWTNAQPYDLARDARAQYIGLVADSYKVYKDPALAATYLQSWTADEKQQAVADAISMYYADGRPDKVQSIRDLQLVMGIGEQPPQVPEQAMGLWDRIRVPCVVFLAVLLILVLGWTGYRQVMSRRSTAVATAGPGAAAAVTVTTARPATRAAPVVPTVEDWEGVGQPPLGHFFTTYKLGEDTYDESFSIETPMGEFLGECGVGISETIGTGEPDKVTAFEVWLFDKSDIRTVTKVLMSEHAYQNDSLRAKLASKGEAVLAQVGTPFTLETSGLELRVDVSEMDYGNGDLPHNSFFSKLTVELVALSKPAGSKAA